MRNSCLGILLPLLATPAVIGGQTPAPLMIARSSPADRPSFVLVVFTKGYAERKEAERRVSQPAGSVYRWAARRPEPRE